MSTKTTKRKTTTKRVAKKAPARKSATKKTVSRPRTTVKKKSTATRKPAAKRTTTKKPAMKRTAPKKTVKKAAKSTQKKEFILQKAGLDKQGHQKLRAVRVYKKKPNGWRELKGATTAPIGYKWICNGKSHLSGEYKSALVRE